MKGRNRKSSDRESVGEESLRMEAEMEGDSWKDLWKNDELG
jgi:hypothetical protein